MRSLDHHGRTTRYRVAGGATDGPTVLYVHGSAATHRLWARQYAPTGPAHPAAALDLSGHGESTDVDTDPGGATLSAYARDVVTVARAVDADVLVGNSLGGAVVQRVTLETEFEPEAVVLAGTGATLGVLEALRERLADDFGRAVEFLHGPDRLFHDATERTVERSRATMHETGRAVTRRDFSTCHAFDVRDRLGEVDVPALAIAGEHDSLTPPASHEYLDAHRPNCRYAEVPDAAHLAMIESPSAFNRRVAAFIGERA